MYAFLSSISAGLSGVVPYFFQASEVLFFFSSQIPDTGMRSRSHTSRLTRVWVPWLWHLICHGCQWPSKYQISVAITCRLGNRCWLWRQVAPTRNMLGSRLSCHNLLLSTSSDFTVLGSIPTVLYVQIGLLVFRMHPMFSGILGSILISNWVMHDGEMRYPIFVTSLNSYRLSYWLYAATCPRKGLQLKSLMILNTYSSMQGRSCPTSGGIATFVTKHIFTRPKDLAQSFEEKNPAVTEKLWSFFFLHFSSFSFFVYMYWWMHAKSIQNRWTIWGHNRA